MIINLNKDSNFVINKLSQRPARERVFDVTGVLESKDVANPIIFARDLDKDNLIEKESISEYVKCIGELGIIKNRNGKSLREIYMNGIPVYWLTSISEKHDSLHWGQAVFFFLKIKDTFPEQFENEKLVFILPKSYGIELSEFINVNSNNCKYS